MGNVQGRVDLREKDGRLQRSLDGGATWADVNYSGWQLAERKVITVDAQSYEFANLNGDIDEAYELTAELIGGAGSAGGLLSARPNGLTASQSASGVGSDGGGAPFGDPRAEMAMGLVPVAGRRSICKATFYAKTGSDRAMVSQTAVASIDRVTLYASRWTDTATNITSLVVFSSAATGLGVGTVLTLLKRVIPG